MEDFLVIALAASRLLWCPIVPMGDANLSPFPVSVTFSSFTTAVEIKWQINGGQDGVFHANY